METANPRYLSLLRNSARVASSANWPQVFTLLSVSCERRHGNQIQDCNCSWSNLSLPLHPESDVGPRQFTLSDCGNVFLSWSYPEFICVCSGTFQPPTLDQSHPPWQHIWYFLWSWLWPRCITITADVFCQSKCYQVPLTHTWQWCHFGFGGFYLYKCCMPEL